MRKYKEFKVWQLGMDIVNSTYDFTKTLPFSERFGLISQIQRASVSIPANIAEGCSRTSEKDFKRFLEISLGSAFEIETLIQITVNTRLAKANEMQPIFWNLTEGQKMLNGLIAKIKDSLIAKS
ncbi:MAG: four helix bundle protein [Candidatus Marinimicrobia bacterium]|jgi:four helix bundle protein|nr:four helix bundle protein [Candidatus Neomarinimicrobiota bacterium]MBT6870679.1 four helix bundle protein [Candidatus Neomarinimicrobiota bacterium]MBT7377708.1 four helix bundle protein [Candidatus Neomarinimicrobiota bacterium]|tara:strand:+ start:5842 stop:6213 length:372 start_codon:yes stop_codon:yes gene_type:complete